MQLRSYQDFAAFTANAQGQTADNSGTKVCETCHTTTTYYNDSGTGAAHETGVCTTCHTHDTGFTPPNDPADTPHEWHHGLYALSRSWHVCSRSNIR